MPRTARNIVEEALTKQRSDFLWTANYLPVLPMTPQQFDIGALLSTILYMARWGHRRGVGKFITTFGQKEGKAYKSPTIADIVKYLFRIDSLLSGFDDETGQAMLGDLLLAYFLENKRHELGHLESVLRVFPTHYLASWIDLPKDVGHLRGVPELLTTLLAQQKNGEYLEPNGGIKNFNIRTGFSNHALLKLFGRNMVIRGEHASALNSDLFIEDGDFDIGIDELLAIRTAQACGNAPSKASGGDTIARISNQWPLANHAANTLGEDLRVFIESYGAIIPRQAFLQILEAGIGLGLTNLMLSTAKIVVDWEVTGKVVEPSQQNSLPLFVDCSNGQDKALRDLSEASSTECIRRYTRLPLIMMLLRVLDDRVRIDRKLRDSLPASIPDSTSWINLLGEIYQEQHPRSESIMNALDEDCHRLADALENDQEVPEPEIANRLRKSSNNPALRLAEALFELMTDKLQSQHFVKTLDCSMMIDQPNGLAIKRRVLRSQSGSTRRMDLRDIIVTPPLLEFLVHRHLQQTATHPKSLSLLDFIKLLRNRYGLYIAQEPLGQPIHQEMLLRNKAYLERQLRDLGLLIGVNDAESLKQLKPHYRMETCNAA